MTDKLDLRLPERPVSPKASVSKTVIFINLMILVLVGATLAIMLFRPGHGMLRGVSAKKDTALSEDVQKQVALKLEKQGLNKVAASAWEEYLAAGNSNKDQIAKIWFRIGKLYQDADTYDQALAAYYRSERISPLSEISSEISRRVQECLEAMGKFAALRDELADRVGMPQPDQDQSAPRQTIVAEIGPQKITVSDIDHQIETVIDRQLSRMAAYLPEDVRNKQKEALLKQFSSTSQRQQFLNQYLGEEILYREARSSDLMNDPAVQSEIKDQERALLAARMVEKMYADNIKITPGDLNNYYEAHKADYMKDDKQKPFEAVKNEVYSALRAGKEQEVREVLLNHLKDKYDVVIHSSVLTSEKEAENIAAPSSNSPASKAK
ncbi:MAG: hypothetical protein ACKVE4_04540 [Dissulfuribacterales bacterium]